MCGVIHAVQERNLLLVAFHLHVLAIGNQRATEAFPVAVIMSNLVVVWESFQFCNNPSVRCTNANMCSVSKGTNACSF